MPTIYLPMVEWTKVGAEQVPGLRGIVLSKADTDQAKALAHKIEIRPGFESLEVEAMSHVGHVAIGPLRIVIRPKLANLPLTRLLRYAYGLRDLGPPLAPLETPTATHGLHDILIALLASEADDLLRAGLSRQYVARDEWLDSPRGRLRVGMLERRGGVTEARLPCRHVERRVDWRLNQVLRAGLQLAASLAEDPDLRWRMQVLHRRMDGVTPIHLDRPVLADAEASLTRLTDLYGPALTLIGLLLDAQGFAAEPGRTTTVPGFLFDMNSFFQRLLSRFLHDNLGVEQRIEDERVVRNLFGYAPGGNPNDRAAPRVRPDFALLENGVRQRLLDAKYRDIWGEGCPAQWLYQLALYALASSDRTSVLLYATTDAAAREERIEVRPPSLGQHHTALATVIVRPVLLPSLAALLDHTNSNIQRTKRRTLARALVATGAEAAALLGV